MANLNAWKMVCTVLVFCAATAIAVPAQTFNSLVNFEGNNGATPDYMSLVQGIDGNLYGTTLYGGNSPHCPSEQGCGSVFKLTPAGTLTTVYNFCQQTDCEDGASPVAGLVLGTNNDFYGIATSGGRDGAGAVFKATPLGRLTTLYNFCRLCVRAPSEPAATVIQGRDGNFYGTTVDGGHLNCLNSGCGTLFQMTPQGKMGGVYRFCAKAGCADGSNPFSALIQGTDGNFYGTTADGGVNGYGTVFRITPHGGLTTLYNFCSQANCADGANPFAGLIQGTDGNFYGTTTYGGNTTCGIGLNCGTIFKFTPTGTLTTLYSFCALSGCADGYFPLAGLIQGTDGNLYGTTAQGGSDLIDCIAYLGGCGTIFRITPLGTLTTLHSFSHTDGDTPRGGLAQSTNGAFFGTTTAGGDLACIDATCGTVFSIDLGLGPFVAFVRNSGRVGQTGGILGQGFTGTTSVLLNGTPASFTVVSDTLIRATVPAGATTGYVTVTTPSGTLTSNVPFHVIQ